MSSVCERLNNVVSNPNNYSKKECRCAFLLLKLYKSPVSVLGSDDNHKNNPYYNDFMLNNNFIDLIAYALKDKDFGLKLTTPILEKIKHIVDESIEFGKDSKEFNIEAAEALKQQIADFFQTDMYAINEVNNAIDKKERIKEHILNLIASQKYVEGTEQNIALEQKSVYIEPGYDKEYTVSVVLENKFMDIVGSLINQNAMSKLMIRKAIEILDLGIKIKNYELEPEESYYYSLFTFDPRLFSFDDEKARNLINRLHNKLSELSDKKR